MRRLVLLAALVVAAAASASPAGATNECRGLQVCVPIAGPWVVVPAKRTTPRPQVQFQLSCPKGYIVAGLDAELSDRAIDVAFLATMGSPVNPGISTTSDAVFVGTYVGNTARLPSFRPHIGCMPTRGGGARTPTAVVFPPGKPVVRHVSNAVLRPPGRALVSAACAQDERLIDAKSAIAYDRPTPPDASLAQLVSVSQSVRGDRTIATVRAKQIPAGTVAIVQVQAICAGGK